MRVLLTGWFSFELMGASAGDLLARDLVAEWLEDSGVPFDLAHAPPFEGGVDWREVDPGRYTHVVFVCGPFGNGDPLVEFLERFRNARLVGVNLTMLEPLNAWNPFDLLLERDSSEAIRPDLVFASKPRPVPVIGLVLRDKGSEYGTRHRYGQSIELVEGVLRSREMAVVRIDTRLDENTSGLRTPAEVEAIIARMDAIVTTRLHGLVMALRNGVPALAIDPIASGGKISRQAGAVGWPEVFSVDTATPEQLEEALGFCLTQSARDTARECASGAASKLDEPRKRFAEYFSHHRS